MAKSGADLKRGGRRKPEPDRRLQERPTTSDADFWAGFESAPDAYLLLAPDSPRFTMVAANDARLRSSALAMP